MNNKKFLILMIIEFGLVLIVGSSYALLRVGNVGTHAYTMNVGNLEVTFKDQETNALTLTNAYPISDEEGLEQTDVLTFVVKNTGNMSAVYDVYIEETSTNPAFKTVIRYVDKKGSNNYSDPKLLSENKYIDSGATLAVNEEVTYTVKLWLSEDADSTYMNKTFKAKIVLEVYQDLMSEMCPGCVYTYTEDTLYYADPNNNGYTMTTLTSSDYQTNYQDVVSASGKNYFLGMKLDNNNQIEKAYACGIYNSHPFCIEGTTYDASNLSTIYERNTDYLYRIYGEYNSGTDTGCTDYGSYVGCLGSVYANAYSSGTVRVGVDDDGRCYVYMDGYLYCYEAGGAT